MTATATTPPPMREQDLRAHTTCTLCGQPIGHSGLPLFWRVRIDRYGVDLDAVRRQSGLTQLLGGSAVLAAAMGPDDVMAKPVMDTIDLTICERCAVEQTHCVAGFAEIASPNEA